MSRSPLEQEFIETIARADLACYGYVWTDKITLPYYCPMSFAIFVNKIKLNYTNRTYER